MMVFSVPILLAGLAIFTLPVRSNTFDDLHDLFLPRDTTKDPKDYSWIRKWAALGDSFTAGIGSGNLYTDKADDRACSRYDYTYPTIINHYLGPSVNQFTYAACSGAISTGVYQQVQALPSGQDLVILSVGGNDLCLSSIIASCVVGGFITESGCQSAIDKANSNLDGFFQDNIKQILTALDAKMNTNGIVVLVKYAQYFNDQTDACTSEDWRVIGLGPGLSLTKDHRTTFNNLVIKTNNALQSAADAVSKTAKTMTLVTANWDPWAPLNGGQFCEPGASPYPNDKSNANVMFFKLNTDPGSHDELKRSDVLLLGNQTDAVTAAQLGSTPLLFGRDPTDPGCPKSIIPIPFPDSIGKIFHPNELGHEIIAAFVLEAIADARSKVLGIAPSCPTVDSMTCYSSTGSHSYASAQALNNNIDDFCNFVNNNHPGGNGWGQSKNYYKGTPDEYTMSVQLSDKTGVWDVNKCKSAIGTIINGCDVPSGGSNPMNWKQGGKRVEAKPTQSCAGWYKFIFQSYDIYGAGWANWDYGQKSLLPSINPCCGSGSVTGWTFDYFDKPDENGYEWHAFFHTAIGTRRRCFDNNKVQCAAGGPCDSYCSGNG